MKHLKLLILSLVLLLSYSSFAALESDPTEAELRQEEFEESLKFQGFPSVDRFLFRSATTDDIRMVKAAGEFDHIDPQGLIPDLILEQALAYFVANRKLIKNQNYLTIIEYSKHSGHSRFYVVNMKTGAVEVVPTAHGSNSDPDDDGHATIFGNEVNSLMSSIGFALTAETYNGKNGYSLRLDGLQSTNSNLRPRAVVVHKSNYVSTDRPKQGRSWGCPAIPVNVYERIINQIKGGSLFYKWFNQ